MPLRLGDGRLMGRSPRYALVLSAILQLESDNVESGPYWMCVDEKTVTIAYQAKHTDKATMLVIPRQHFETLLEWYETEQSIT